MSKDPYLNASEARILYLREEAEKYKKLAYEHGPFTEIGNRYWNLYADFTENAQQIFLSLPKGIKKYV